MQLKGKISNLSFSYTSKLPCITFEVESVPDEINDLVDLNLDIDVRKHRKKRSLDANAYCWVLCTKIAEKVKSSKDEVYESMIKQYGTLDMEDGQYIVITMKSYIPEKALGGHWLMYTEKDGFTSYLKIKGSSEYTTGEMSKFLEGIVYEAKELGIETMTPQEIERMSQHWGNQ